MCPKESARSDLGPISVSVREVTPTTSPGNPGPGLLTTASVTAPTPPAESTTTTTTPSPSGHHSHFQGKNQDTFNLRSVRSSLVASIEKKIHVPFYSAIQVFICWVRRDPSLDRYSHLCYRSPLGSTILYITRSSISWNRIGTLWL